MGRNKSITNSIKSLIRLLSAYIFHLIMFGCFLPVQSTMGVNYLLRKGSTLANIPSSFISGMFVCIWGCRKVPDFLTRGQGFKPSNVQVKGSNLARCVLLGVAREGS